MPKKLKLVDNWKKHLRAYSFLSLISSFMIAVAYGASLALGIGATSLSPGFIIGAMGVVAALGACGKFIKQTDGESEGDKDEPS